MNESGSMLSGLSHALQDLVLNLLGHLPKVVAAVLVLIVGWLIAKLSKMIIVRAIGRLDQFWHRAFTKRGLTHLQPRQPPTRVVGELVFWLLVLVFVTLAADIAGLELFGTWLREILAYLPLMVGGVFIVLIGFVVSSLVRELITSAAASAGLSHGDMLGRTMQVIILSVAIIIGVDQIGFEIAFLSIIAGIVLAASLGGISLAFGLGARTHVSNIIAANQLRSFYQVGDVVRVGEMEGRIIDISISRVIIEAESATVDIPAKLFDEQITMIIEKGS